MANKLLKESEIKDLTVNNPKDMDSDITKKIKNFENLAWMFIVVGGLAFTSYFLFKYLFREPPLSEIGDFTGGVVNAFWALAGLFFIYVAFLGQQKQIKQQQTEIRINREELELNREELKLTREELKGQKEQMIEQNKILAQQRFETTFFNMLTLYESMVSELEYTCIIEPLRDSQKQIMLNFGEDHGNQDFYTLRGKPIFSFFNVDMACIFNTIKDNSNFRQLKMQEAYDSRYEMYKQCLDRYFRSFLQILVLFDNFESLYNPSFYLNLLKAKQSKEEISLIFYAMLMGENFNNISIRIKKLFLEDIENYEEIITKGNLWLTALDKNNNPTELGEESDHNTTNTID